MRAGRTGVAPVDVTSHADHWTMMMVTVFGWSETELGSHNQLPLEGHQLEDPIVKTAAITPW